MPRAVHATGAFLGGASAAVLTFVSDVQPTGARLADLLWTVGLGCFLGWIVNHASPVAWLGVAAIGAASLQTLGDSVHIALTAFAGLATFRVAKACSSGRLQVETVARYVAALTLPWNLLRLSDAGVEYLSATLAIGCVCGLIVSALVAASPKARLRVAVGAAGITLAAAAIGAVAVGSIQSARRDAMLGERNLRAALSSAGNGDLGVSAERLSEASTNLTDAHDRLASIAVSPLQYVPLVGPNISAAQELTSHLRPVVSASDSVVTAAVQLSEVAGPDGLDLSRVDDATRTVDRLVSTIASLDDSVSRRRTTWLLPPLSEALGDLETELGTFNGQTLETLRAQSAVDELLGRNMAKQYLVIFGNPAEARELGGFAGGTALLSVNAGRIEVVRTDRPSVLNDSPASPNVFDQSPPQRFMEYRPWLYSQNFTAMADFPTLAHAVRDLYRDMGGERVDGVLYLDTRAFSALLAITGPVYLNSLDATVSADNVSRLLTVEQYVHFDKREDRSQLQDREDFLAELMSATFSQLLAPGANAGEARSAADSANLRPLIRAVRQDRFLFVPFEEDASAFTDALGLSGSIAPIGSGDYIAVSHINGGPNKLDAYLTREISYIADVDQSTGELFATVTVRLTNAAPSVLPDYAGGNAHGYPSGTNRLTLIVHTPHEAVEWVGGHEPELTRSFREFDRWRHERVVAVPAGETVEVTLDLVGAVQAGPTYNLDIGHQPLVHDDEFTALVKPFLDESFVLRTDRRLTAATISLD